jgi:hypothetical protein
MKVLKREGNEPFQCSRSITAGSTIYETFEKLIKNGVKDDKNLTKCVEDFFTKNFAAFKDVQGYVDTLALSDLLQLWKIMSKGATSWSS